MKKLVGNLWVGALALLSGVSLMLFIFGIINGSVDLNW